MKKEDAYCKGKSLSEIKIKRKELREKIKREEKRISEGGGWLGLTPHYQRIALLKAELKGINWVVRNN